MTRVRWLNRSSLWLLMLLQRTPALRVAADAVEFATSTRVVSLLKSAVVAAASLGAIDSWAGATHFAVNNANVGGTVGAPITPVIFTVTGAMTVPGSFRITGMLPPGLSVPGISASVVNTSTGEIIGTPTSTGTFSISILAFESANAQGDSFGPTTIRFTIAGSVAVGPTFTSQPVDQSVNAGAAVTFSVGATGSPAPTYQWQKDAGDIPDATSSTLTLPNVQAADAGKYRVTVSNVAGIVTSNAATLEVKPLVSPPAITTQPASQYVSPGTSVVLSVAATGTALHYQWKKDGAAIDGAVSPTLTVENATAANMGFYSATIASDTGETTSNAAILTINTGGASRLINVATRGYVSAGSALTPGFVLQGTGSKPLVIRAVGPTLSEFSVNGALADPKMEVIPLGGTTAVATNDNWGGSTALSSAFTAVGAFPLDQPASKDATVVGSLPATGATGYSIRITSTSPDGAGIALAEIYDDGPITAGVRLVNVSTIGFVGIGDQALIPGFVIGGNAPKQVLIRAVGPGLEPFGVPGLLSDPQLSVVPLGKNFSVAANDNWGGGAALQAGFAQAAAFKLSPESNDAAVIVRLPPGGYSVVVSGVGQTTGTALVEVYDLDP